MSNELQVPEAELLRESFLLFYATMQNRNLVDVRREYLGIAPPGSDKYTVASNKLYLTTETAVAQLSSQLSKPETLPQPQVNDNPRPVLFNKEHKGGEPREY